MNGIRTLAVVLSFALVLPLTATAVEAHHEPAVKPARSSAQLVDGEVRRVDMEAKKLTIKHGPIRNLDMPAMTMVFRVADAAMLDQVKAGDRIKFAADKRGGALTVMKIEPVR